MTHAKILLKTKKKKNRREKKWKLQLSIVTLQIMQFNENPSISDLWIMSVFYYYIHTTWMHAKACKCMHTFVYIYTHTYRHACKNFFVRVCNFNLLLFSPHNYIKHVEYNFAFFFCQYNPVRQRIDVLLMLLLLLLLLLP